MDDLFKRRYPRNYWLWNEDSTNLDGIVYEKDELTGIYNLRLRKSFLYELVQILQETPSMFTQTKVESTWAVWKRSASSKIVMLLTKSLKIKDFKIKKYLIF